MSARFGPAGNSESYLKTVSKSSLGAPRYLAEMGLTCYEYQCGKGVNVGEETARAFGAQAKEHGIALSLHAPYFINLANPSAESRQKTFGYILKACEAASFMGATRVIVHSGSPLKRTRAEAMQTARETLLEALKLCEDSGFSGITLCPETMGKINQLGDLDEVLTLCEADERLLPCIDFGHLYARSLGAFQGEDAMEQALLEVERRIGTARARVFHSHFSKIEFTPNGGEARHLTFSQTEFGPDFLPLARAVARRGWSPVFICESAGTQSEDALFMKGIYDAERARLSPSKSQ